MYNISLTDFKKVIDSLSFDFIYDDICCIRPIGSTTLFGSIEDELQKGKYICLEFKYIGSWTYDSFVLEEVVIVKLELHKNKDEEKYTLNDSHKDYLKKMIEDYINSI